MVSRSLAVWEREISSIRIAFMVADIYKTSVCPLAKVMRRELRARKIDSLKVVYSKEIPRELSESDAIDCKKHCVCPPASERTCAVRRQIPGYISFVPSVVALILAGDIGGDHGCS